MSSRPVLALGVASLVAVSSLLAPSVLVPAAGAVTARGSGASPVVVHQGQVIRQDVRSRPGSEPDTVVEPDVAVSPRNPDVAIAAAHDSRYPDGGAVDVSAAWTADGGASWHHRPVQDLTTATGGTYQRASDPVVAFGPDGTAYLSVLVFDQTTCRTAVAVLRSADGGQTWSRPVLAHRSGTCNVSDDKNWLIVDNEPHSPHRGRVYQFWTIFLSTNRRYVGSAQGVRWSDDHGRTWSSTSYITPRDHGTQNSQPMIEADGTVVDTFFDSGRGNMAPDVVGVGRPGPPHDAALRAPQARRARTVDASGDVYAATSDDGGRTWSPETQVVTNAGGYADGVRCCLFAADIDPVTHVMYVAYHGGVGDTDPIYTVFSTDGEQWSSPVRVTRGDVPGVQRVNVDVVARGGDVYVAYGTRTQPGQHGGFVQQQISTSTNRGYGFGPPYSVGPRSVLRYAAQAGGYFPGDYIGLALAPGRLYGVWAVSSVPPPYSTSRYHQIIYGATLRV